MFYTVVIIVIIVIIIIFFFLVFGVFLPVKLGQSVAVASQQNNNMILLLYISPIRVHRWSWLFSS